MILHILRIIGLCLLILLLILLALILIILFVPIHYEIKGYKKPPSGDEPPIDSPMPTSGMETPISALDQETPMPTPDKGGNKHGQGSDTSETTTDPDWRVMARVHWILHIIRGSVRFDSGGLQYSVYIFWKKLMSSEETSDELEEEKADPSSEKDGRAEEKAGTKTSGTEIADTKAAGTETEDLPEKTDISQPFTVDNLDFSDISEKKTEDSSEEKDDTDSSDLEASKTKEAVDLEKLTFTVDGYTVLKEPGDPDELVLPETSDADAETAAQGSDSDHVDEISATPRTDFKEKAASAADKATENINAAAVKATEKATGFGKKLKDLVKKLQGLWQKLTDEDNQEAAQLAIYEVKYLLHHIRLRKIDGELTFGFDDPATMGQVLSILALIYPKLCGKVSVNPLYDVDETIIYGKIYTKGHIRLIHVLIAAIKILMNKTLRTMIFGRRTNGER